MSISSKLSLLKSVLSIPPSLSYIYKFLFLIAVLQLDFKACVIQKESSQFVLYIFLLYNKKEKRDMLQHTSLM